MSDSRKLRRSKDNRMVAGVAAGVAEYFDLDPTVVRLVWVLMVIFAGFGVLLYLIMWIVVPEEASEPTRAVDTPTESPEPSEEE
jgi:phage shock protein C